MSLKYSDRVIPGERGERETERERERERDTERERERERDEREREEEKRGEMREREGMRGEEGRDKHEGIRGRIVGVVIGTCVDGCLPSSYRHVGCVSYQSCSLHYGLIYTSYLYLQLQ